MRKTLAAAGLVLAACAAHAQSLPGEYNVEGRDFNGKAYSGQLRISAAGPVFRLKYSDNRTIRGMGIQRGNQLFTAWGPSDKCTVSALEVTANGGMEGSWSDLAHDSVGTETMKKQAGAPDKMDGTYVSAGRTPDGEKYDGLTTVETRGQVFRFTYKDDSTNQTGVGIRQGQGVGVAYGGKNCGISVYTIATDGTLTGPYAEPGDNRIGVETIRKTR